MLRAILVLSLAAAALPGVARAQALTERGFVEARGVQFLRSAPADPEPVIGEVNLRQEVFAKPAAWVQFAAGVDLRADSHDQVENEWRLDISDRGVLRPRLSVRRLAATITKGPFTLDIGKQFIRWGRTDIVAPTDRFAPRDFLNVIDTTFLAVTGARGVVQVGADTLDVVWVPRFTPSRVPLLNQRWTVVPPELATAPIVDASGPLPTKSQTGVRWSHVAGALEFSLSAFDGFNHQPDIHATVSDGRVRPIGVEFSRVYPPVRSYGADIAVPTRWFTIKGETEYVTSRSSQSDEYVLYVVELERQTGEWMLSGGYVDEVITRNRGVASFSFDRGLARSVVGRAAYTIDPNHGFVLEAAVRRDGRGAYAKGEYSQARGSHWRTTLTAVALGGEPDDFLGRYRRNSNVALAVRYSF